MLVAELLEARGKNKIKTHIDKYAPPDDVVPKKLGGGKLKELILREMPSGEIIHYSYAYINPLIYGDDNGRVLGYDNSHGYSHKHLMGEDHTR